MKQKILTCLLIILIVIGCFIGITKHSITYIYLDKNTQTNNLKYISKSVKFLKDGFTFAQNEARKDNLKFKYTFYNAYGSGFIKNNPIPNDLDFAVGLDLGEYDYDGTNSEVIAKNLIDKMDSFKYFFSIYISQKGNKHCYITKKPLTLINEATILYNLHVSAISNYLDKALEGTYYMTSSITDQSKVEIKYLMNPYEILVPKYGPLMLYSDEVSYSPDMPKYMREISIVPEFRFRIKNNDKTYNITLIPEAFDGERLHLVRRIFAPNVFVNPPSRKYISKLELLNNEDTFVEYRMLSLRRHLQEISNITALETKPVKMFKRIMQTANIVYPLLTKEEYDKISETVNNSLNNPEVMLLNEYLNMCGNIFAIIIEEPDLFIRLENDNKISEIYDVFKSTISALRERNQISNENIEQLEKFYKDELIVTRTAKSVEELNNIILKNDLLNKYNETKLLANNLIYSITNENNVINDYVKHFNEIYEKAGYKKVDMWWLDSNTIGVVRDKNTRNIKNFEEIATANKLPIANYKFINKSQAPKVGVSYAAWVRLNTTEEQDIYYEKMMNIMKQDLKNYKTKSKNVIY